MGRGINGVKCGCMRGNAAYHEVLTLMRYARMNIWGNSRYSVIEQGSEFVADSYIFDMF